MTYRLLSGRQRALGPTVGQATGTIDLDPVAYSGAIVHGSNNEMYRSDGVAWRPIAGNTKVIGPGLPQPVPIALDPVEYEGAWVYGEDGEMHRSDGVEWKSVVETAQDVMSNVVRYIDYNITITVGAAGDYPTLTEAFQYLSQFRPSVSLPSDTTFLAYQQGLVRILSGFEVAEQIVVDGETFGWVRIISDDAAVPVDESALTRSEAFFDGTSSFPLFTVRNGGVSPRIACHFVCDPDGLNRNTVGLFIRNGRYQDDLLTDIVNPHGFSGFNRNVWVSAAQAYFIKKTFNNARTYGIQADWQGIAVFENCTARGAASAGRSLFMDMGSHILIAGGDYRRDDSDTGTATLVNSGGVLSIRNAYGPVVPDGPVSVFGRTSIPVNRISDRAYIFDVRETVILARGVLQPTSYTVATVPSPVTYAASIIYVSNGNSGLPCLAVSEGGTWKRIALGSTIST